ncbi:MAG: glycoside hydrolase family 99-like domain-containing protein [Puniceicoccales bacterium]
MEKKLSRPQLATYYFPGFHADPRNELHRGKGWSEWDLVKAAGPRFPGHLQPKVPVLGYRDESTVGVMEENIDLAADHGIDCFLFDWYWYEDRPFLQRPLDDAFLTAGNRDRLKFALMWANHDWVDIFPKRLRKDAELIFAGAVTLDVFKRLTDYAIEHYFTKSNYWKVDGKPYFCIFQLQTLISGLGGLDQAVEAVEDFRYRVGKAGFSGLHLNTIVWGRTILPNDPVVKNQQRAISSIGFDSLTSYVWPNNVEPEGFPQTSYQRMADKAAVKWEEIQGGYQVPYHPNVTVGWDTSPRAYQGDPFEKDIYPYVPVYQGNSPDILRDSLRRAAGWVQRHDKKDQIVTLNAWNEWTEGSYLEPDTEYGMERLKAVADVFSPREVVS